MSSELTTIVFAVSAIVALLVMIFAALSIKYDRAVSAQGPIEELSVYAARIEQKKELLNDVEAELEKRREAIAHVADVQAEVESLVNQRENLHTEWASLEERRQEVLAVREEMEAAMNERLSIETELAEKRAEYEALRDRIERAEQMALQTEAMKKEEAELRATLDDLREEVIRLEAAEKRVGELSLRSQELETEISRKQGAIEAREATLGELEQRLATEREALSEGQAEAVVVQSEIAAGRLEVIRQTSELDNMTQTLGKMEARLAVLEREIANAEDAAATTGLSAESDPLRELQEQPEVIKQLAALPAPLPIREEEALHNVEKRLSAFGLEYPQRTLRAFHTAMKVNGSTQMAVLAGISGTGKSQLPRQYAAGMGIGFLQVPVQPRWDSPQDLMGFYNYIEGRFRPTDMARALWALDPINNPGAELEGRMMMILLDEMNLARVEYYFSDFLSRLESRPSRDRITDKQLRKDSEIELEIPKLDQPPRIFPGYNLLFAGTMNEDESTQSLSDKVVDRANILRFSAPRQIINRGTEGIEPVVPALSLDSWNRWVTPISEVEDEHEVINGLNRMVELMKEFKRPFGHRLGRAILAYVANYPRLDGADALRNALADQVEMRLLPKLRGVEVEFAETHFGDLRKFVGETLGDEALSEAIRDSISLAEATGQFVWSGVTR